MVEEEEVQRWLEKDIITSEQADRILESSSKYRKEKTSGNIVTALSVIGSILLGIGAILFVAANWQGIPDFLKLILLVGSTFGVYYLGYLFRYDKKNFPRVGSALVFLGALFFGASVALITQIYNLPIAPRFIVIIWILGTLPVVYLLKTKAIAGLSSVLYFLCVSLFTIEHITYRPEISIFPSVILLSSILLFKFGGVHHIFEKYSDIAKVYRSAGIKVMMASLFVLTFGFISTPTRYTSVGETNYYDLVIILGLAGFGLLFIFLDKFFEESKRRFKFENSFMLGMLVIILFFIFFPFMGDVGFLIIFNLAMIFVIALIFYMGYTEEDMALVHSGGFWLAIYLLARYFDFFWELLPRSLFFLFGGLIVVLGGVYLERKRKSLKSDFGGN